MKEPKVWNPLTRRLETRDEQFPIGENGQRLKKRDLTNLGVTPMLQRTKGKGKLSLVNIIEDTSLRSQFRSTEFPSFSLTDKTYFFTPVTKVTSITGTYYIKWFSLDQNFRIAHDHNYQFASLNPEGYLMKITVSRLSREINDFQIAYVCDVNDIHCSEMQAQEEVSGRTLDDLPKVKSYLSVQEFNPMEYPSIMAMVENPDSRMEFIQNCLSDILED